jgi:hypothetical protein
MQIKIQILILWLFLSGVLAAQNQVFVVYSDGFEHGIPSGVMGSNDGKGLSVIENWETQPYNGKVCLKISNDGSEEWNGIHILANGRMGDQSENREMLVRLKGYNYFEFYARADKNVSVIAGFGEGEDDAFSDQNVQLTTQWKRYSYYVGDVNLETLNSLFFVSLNKKCTVYFDNILFVKKQRGDKSETKIVPVEAKNAYSEPHVPSKVEVTKINGKFELLKNGIPFYIKGAGGSVFLDKVKAYGGNSIRTWSDENAGAILDSAYKHGLMVMFGLWMQHERHGFNYDDKEKVRYQLEKFRQVVTKYKDHPALLLWGIGNELDLFYTNTNVWYAVEDVAKMIHETDPNHPTSTVTAGLDTAETKLIVQRCPDIDIYGVNTYGDIGGVASKFRLTDWHKPYMITEWGPTGHWEIEKTEFGVPIEQTSTEKASIYRERYGYITADSQMCIGSYVFLWGNKQETTPTWYGVFLPNGVETEVVDVIQQNWSGKLPENKSPKIKSLLIEGKAAKDNIYLDQDNTYLAKADILEPENEPLRYEWVIMPESTTTKAGGDFEEKPEAMPELLKESKGNTLTFVTPTQPGAYRLFVYAYDQHNNAAVANTIFYVNE